MRNGEVCYRNPVVRRARGESCLRLLRRQCNSERSGRAGMMLRETHLAQTNSSLRQRQKVFASRGEMTAFQTARKRPTCRINTDCRHASACSNITADQKGPYEYPPPLIDWS